MSFQLNDAERREIAQLLRAGHSAAEVARRTGRAPWTVRKVRDDHEIPSGPSGRPARRGQDDDDYEQLDWPSRAKPWIPPPGYDPYRERPNQAEWLALLARVSPDGRRRLRAAVCQVPGLSVHSSDEGIVKALIADHRSADDLARRYLDAALGRVT